jgi:hypothetical protein
MQFMGVANKKMAPLWWGAQAHNRFIAKAIPLFKIF